MGLKAFNSFMPLSSVPLWLYLRSGFQALGFRWHIDIRVSLAPASQMVSSCEELKLRRSCYLGKTGAVMAQSLFSISEVSCTFSKVSFSLGRVLRMAYMSIRGPEVAPLWSFQDLRVSGNLEDPGSDRAAIALVWFPSPSQAPRRHVSPASALAPSPRRRSK
jgi:hypothetical protein